MFHKDISLIIKPPEPSSKGLTDWDKNYITDAQSGPFYGPKGVQEKWAKSGPQSTIPVDKQLITLGLTMGLTVMVFLVAILLCLMTSRGAGIQKMSWNMWSHGFSVFYAFLLFVALKDVALYYMTSWSGATYTLGSSLTLLLEVVVVIHLLLFTFRSWPLTLLALGSIGLSVISFAAIDLFEIVKRLSMFEKGDFFVSSSMFILAVVAIAVFVALSTSHRELLDWSLRNSERSRAFCQCCCLCCFDPESVNRPDWNEWKKQASKCEDQLAAITSGYLISQALEWAILRAMPEHSVSFNFHVLLMAIACLVVLSMTFALWTRTGSENQENRFTLTALNICMLAAGWCIFHATEWQYSGGFVATSLSLEPKSFTVTLLVALTISFIALFTFMVICFYSLSYHTAPWDETLLRNFQALVFALGFVLGVAWVSCFITALPGIAANFPKTDVLPTVPAALIVSILVLPVWGVFVLPRTIIAKTVDDD